MFSQTGPGFSRTLIQIYRKEVILEWRNPSGLVTVFIFSLVLAALFHFAMAEGVFDRRRNLQGAILVVLFFSSTIITGRNLHRDREWGALKITLLAPLDPAGLFLGKVLALWQIHALLALVFVPLLTILLSGRLPASGSELIITILLLLPASLSLAALGTVFSYLSSASRLREFLLPVLLLPFSLPVLMLAAQALRRAVPPKTAPILILSDLLIQLAPAAIFCSLGSLVFTTLAADE